MRSSLIALAALAALTALAAPAAAQWEEWIHVPAGGFAMGCAPQDASCLYDEVPEHWVIVSAFDVTVTEVTQFQANAYAGYSGSHHQNCPDCPAESMTWDEAAAICEAMGGRLPTEAEWERAARSDVVQTWACGDDPSCLDGAAWYVDNSGGETHPVGEKGQTPWGLRDAMGNAAEWVSDWYDPHYYDLAPVPPEFWEDPQGPAGGTMKVLRGGAYSTSSAKLRLSSRWGIDPALRNYAAGVRCARDAGGDDDDTADDDAADDDTVECCLPGDPCGLAGNGECECPSMPWDWQDCNPPDDDTADDDAADDDTADDDAADDDSEPPSDDDSEPPADDDSEPPTDDDQGGPAAKSSEGGEGGCGC